MSINFQEILKELEYRVEHGIIDLTKEEQVTKLAKILKENGVSNANQMAQKARVYFSYLNEDDVVKSKESGNIYMVKNFNPKKHDRPTPDEIEKAKQSNGGKLPSSDKPTTGGVKPTSNKPTAPKADIGLSGAEKDKEKKTNKPQSTQSYVSKNGEAEMESRDGSSFEGYRSGKMKAPGTPAGAFAEVAGMKVAGYLRAHPNASDEELGKYISDWAKKGKVTKAPSVSGGDKLTAAIHTGRAIFEEVGQVGIEEGYDPKTTTAEGYWGSEESKQNAINRVNEIRKQNPKATFNGQSADEYINIIKANGAGENPTDTMLIIWDGKSNNVGMLHVSNKIGSNNIQANSTVTQTYDRAQKSIEKSSLKPAEKEAAIKSITKRKLNGTKLQKQQKDYQTSFLGKYSKLTKTPAALKALTNDIYGDVIRRGDAVDKMFTGSGNIGKACKKLTKPHPACKMVDNPKAKPAAKVAAMFDFYSKYPDAAPSAVREIISRTATIKTDKGIPKYKTGYDSTVINTLYGKMNNEVEGMRQDLNKIQNGLGDRMITHDFASRLHLTIAEGHNPGGIPANRFKLVMGNNEADIWYDKTGQAYQKVKNAFHKVNDDGSLDKNPTTLKGKDVNRGNIATIGDVDNFQHCLGVPKGKTIEEHMNVKYDKINTKTGIQSAHIFDINGREVGIMTIRTKSGPGGDANDTLQFSKDMQNCMQKQEYLKKKRK
jgi:hypothetical protein